MRDVSELRSLKEQPGGTIYVIGGAALVSSLMNEGLIDELRLIVHPIVLGGGKAPFGGITDRRTLELVQFHDGKAGRVVLTYRT
jgi:dihydrofolate reductase